MREIGNSLASLGKHSAINSRMITIQTIDKEHNMMHTRNLGTQGLTVSAIGLGCMGMTGMFGTPGKREDMITLIQKPLNMA